MSEYTALCAPCLASAKRTPSATWVNGTTMCVECAVKAQGTDDSRGVDGILDELAQGKHRRGIIGGA